MTDFGDAVAIFRTQSRFTIIGHTNPDGDTLGSTLALGLGLESLGKQVTMCNVDRIPEIYRFLPGVDRVIQPTAELFRETVVVCVDCTDPKRAGDETVPWITGAKTVVNIDHHISNGYYAGANVVDADAAAAGLIILTILKELGIKISRDIATCLYVTLITDTGSFRYTNTTPQAFMAAAELLAAGPDQERINRELYEEVPLTGLQLIKVGLENLRVSPCGKVAWIILTKLEMEHLKAADEHLEGLVNYAKSVRGVEVGILFRESEENLIKISFRSKSSVNVSDLAANFGGGGHIRAAGCRYRVPLSEAVSKVTRAAVEAVRNSNDRNH